MKIILKPTNHYSQSNTRLYNANLLDDDDRFICSSTHETIDDLLGFIENCKSAYPDKNIIVLMDNENDKMPQL